MDIALRLLTWLADNEEQASTKEIASQLGASYHNTVKIIGSLQNFGIITTKQGKGGGIQLRTNANQITLLTVLNAIEGNINLAYCNRNNKECNIETDSCSIRHKLNTIEMKMNHLLSETTIADFIRNKRIQTL